MTLQQQHIVKSDPLNPKIEYEDTYAKDSLSEVSPADVDISSNYVSLSHLFDKLRGGEINLETAFQRNNIWNKGQQSRLIESILVRIPIPAFYFDGRDDRNWLIIDGQQRIATFYNFIIQKKLKLENLEYLPQFNGSTFDDLPRDLQRRLLETEVPVFLVNPGTPKDVIFNIFQRINTGGISLKPQEIRNALNHGTPADLMIKKLAKSKAFKHVTGEAVSSERMEDQYIITRFLAFYLTEYQDYTPELEKFLNVNITKFNELSEVERGEIETQFIKAMNTSWEIFKDDAFRKRFNLDDTRNPFNKALFEAWAVNLARLNDKETQKVIQRKEVLNDIFIDELNSDKNFLKSVSSGTGDTKNVKKRFKTIHQIIQQAIQ